MERSETMPERALDSTGTPNTGSGVMAATIPARSAHPPDPIKHSPFKVNPPLFGSIVFKTHRVA